MVDINLGRKDRLFCDTSFFCAAIISSDSNHFLAKKALFEHQKASLITTWDIVSETVTFLRYRGNYRLAIRFLDEVRPYLDLFPYDDSTREEAVRVFRKFSKDKKLSFCDCLSFVILSVCLPEVPVLTFDSDFRQFGFTNVVGV